MAGKVRFLHLQGLAFEVWRTGKVFHVLPDYIQGTYKKGEPFVQIDGAYPAQSQPQGRRYNDQNEQSCECPNPNSAPCYAQRSGSVRAWRVQGVVRAGRRVKLGRRVELRLGTTRRHARGLH